MLEKIAKIFKEYKGDDNLKISAETTFEELELDSLDVVELVMSLEEEFEVTIEMDENIKSIKDLIRVIENS